MLGPLSTSMVVLAIVFPVMAVIAVGLRFYCRRLKGMGCGIDDWLILTALLLAIGLGVVTCIGVFMARLGEHVSIRPDGKPMLGESVAVFYKVDFVIQLISLPCLTITKLSILFFYRRIFRGAIFSFVTWALIAVTIALCISFLVVELTQCMPIQEIWSANTSDPNRHCINVFPMVITASASGCIIDFLILCVPWPNVWQLRLQTKQKLAVMGIFMLGALICGISIVRFVFLLEGTNNPEGLYLDATYSAGPSVYWTQLETSFGVICACLPTLRPLFESLSMESILSSRGGRTFSALLSRMTSSRETNYDENDSSVTPRSSKSLPRDSKETAEYVPNGRIRVKRDLDLSFTTRT